MSEEQTAQDPLPVRLRSIPRDWREMREVGYCHHRSTCRGREPGTPSTCPACEVWHRLFGELSPPKPVPLANTWTGIVKGSVGVPNT